MSTCLQLPCMSAVAPDFPCPQTQDDTQQHQGGTRHCSHGSLWALPGSGKPHRRGQPAPGPRHCRRPPPAQPACWLLLPEPAARWAAHRAGTPHTARPVAPEPPRLLVLFLPLLSSQLLLPLPARQPAAGAWGALHGSAAASPSSWERLAGPAPHLGWPPALHQPARSGVEPLGPWCQLQLPGCLPSPLPLPRSLWAAAACRGCCSPSLCPCVGHCPSPATGYSPAGTCSVPWGALGPGPGPYLETSKGTGWSHNAVWAVLGTLRGHPAPLSAGL